MVSPSGRTVGRTSGNVTQARLKGDHARGTRKGTVRAPGARTGTGMASSRLRKGTIRSQNTYR